MHYQFMEQRERLMQEVESSTAANCHFQPPRNLFPSSPSPGSTPPHHKASPRRNTSPFRTPSPQQTSPRDHRGSPRSQHSPTRQQSSPVRSQQPLSSSTAGLNDSLSLSLNHTHTHDTCAHVHTHTHSLSFLACMYITVCVSSGGRVSSKPPTGLQSSTQQLGIYMYEYSIVE